MCVATASVQTAKAVSKKPRTLILDEPSAVLSQEVLRHLFFLIDQLKPEGTDRPYLKLATDDSPLAGLKLYEVRALNGAAWARLTNQFAGKATRPFWDVPAR